MKQRLLAGLLGVMMLLSMLPVPSMAAAMPTSEPISEKQEAGLPISVSPENPEEDSSVQEESGEEPAVPEDPENPAIPEDPEGSVIPEDPEDPEDPVDPENPEGTESPEEEMPLPAGELIGPVKLEHMQYYYRLPEGYDPSWAYPLIVAMPGVGEYAGGYGNSRKKTDDERNKKAIQNWNGYTCWLNTDSPAIILIPQHIGDHSTRDGTVEEIVSAIQTLEAQYSVDPNRIYGTGFSGGGHYMSLVVSRNPELFAAYIHGSSLWEGSDSAFAKIAQNRVAIYFWIGAKDGNKTYQKSFEQHFAKLKKAYQAAGMGEEDLNRLLVQEKIPGIGHQTTKFYQEQGKGNWVFQFRTGNPTPVKLRTIADSFAPLAIAAAMPQGLPWLTLQAVTAASARNLP